MESKKHFSSMVETVYSETKGTLLESRLSSKFVQHETRVRKNIGKALSMLFLEVKRPGFVSLLVPVPSVVDKGANSSRIAILDFIGFIPENLCLQDSRFQILSITYGSRVLNKDIRVTFPGEPLMTTYDNFHIHGPNSFNVFDTAFSFINRIFKKEETDGISQPKGTGKIRSLAGIGMEIFWVEDFITQPYSKYRIGFLCPMGVLKGPYIKVDNLREWDPGECVRLKTQEDVLKKLREEFNLVLPPKMKTLDYSDPVVARSILRKKLAQRDTASFSMERDI